ncbi:DNA polymerase catalytic subunit-like protein [Phocid alphaherpesvirus 1]|uniref:DNA polymerase n=2 Tax=Alphaherpesvirinae TaxID=10293 RepID=A0A482F753_9ALPH|nr:DNA polymerase catalytic subunit-like protein [Phocid alphaherpesvirus 1]QBN85151.1 DNA polymerase catalytic subunit-like protein [Phocid alphaherpesvirus 1]
MEGGSEFETPRREFFNPFTSRNNGRDMGSFQKGYNKSCNYTYYTNICDFKFIAPRSLDEDVPTEQQKGVHIGTLSRSPKVYYDGEDYDILDFNSNLPWPTRIYNWGDKSFIPSDFNFKFEKFHVYDIIETTEFVNNNDDSRFAMFIRPSGNVVTLLGISDTGKRVAVHVYGVKPYFYMEKDVVDRLCKISCGQELISAMLSAINNSSVNNSLYNRAKPNSTWSIKASRECFKVDIIQATTVYYFDSEPKLYYKVSTNSSRLCNYICDNFHPEITKYESNVDVVSRFILDNHGFLSFGWYKLKPGTNGEKVQLRSAEKQTTSSDIEINCTVDNLVPMPYDESWPDYKLLCFDIECKSGTGNELAFPISSNQEDLVIQISCLLYSLSSMKHEHTLLFSLGSCDLPERYLEENNNKNQPKPIVLEFDSEFEMLLAFLTFLKQYSPEFVTGYNIVNFDWSYITNKLKSVYNINLDGYGKFNKGGLFKVWDIGQNNFQKRSKVKINGLITLDMYSIATEKLKLASYKLNTVAGEALGEYKIDLPYKEIPGYYAAGPDKRGVIGEYCIQDSVLVGKLFFKFLPHLELSAVAKLANITLTRAIFDGQQIRIYTCLLKLARENGFILPDNRNKLGDIGDVPESMDCDLVFDEDSQMDDGETVHEPRACKTNSGRSVGYQGAKVLDPISGFHVDPVMVLDFASLYPSIIQAHNLCFTTLTTNPSSVSHLKKDIDYSEFIVNGQKLIFVHSHIRESLLSILLRDWLVMRKAIRARIPKSSEDEAVLLDKQQAAIKVVCNSVYGFTGVSNGLLPCLHIAATVTTIGRSMLLATQNYVESRWATRELLEKDFPNASSIAVPNKSYYVKIIYGDTDSVFIKFVGLTYEGISELGDVMAQQISKALFKAPIKLECEKTFHKLLLITKKKYIGVINGGKMLMKGVDLVRKNNCNFINSYSRRLVNLLLYDNDVSQAAAEITNVPPNEWLSRPLPAKFSEFGRVLSEAYNQITSPNLNVSEFIMTAELSRSPEMYKNKRIPHLTVYYKLLMRNEEVPNVKERIPYVIVSPTESVKTEVSVINSMRDGNNVSVVSSKQKTKKILISDLAEDPTYVSTNSIPLNTDYYFSHLLSTISVTFKALFGNDIKTTETLLKRFIPETRDNNLQCMEKLSMAGFEKFSSSNAAAENLQMLHKVFCIPKAAPHRN